MPLTPMSTYEDVPCLVFRTSAGALVAEDMLRDEGRSYRTKIVRTRKRGIEYVVMVLD